MGGLDEDAELASQELGLIQPLQLEKRSFFSHGACIEARLRWKTSTKTMENHERSRKTGAKTA